MMADHIHGCLTCRPDMVPDFSRDDPRYHDGGKCRYTMRAFIGGIETGYTTGVYEGREGWVLLASETYDAAEVHLCGNCYDPIIPPEEREHVPAVCVEPRFGVVTVEHLEALI